VHCSTTDLFLIFETECTNDALIYLEV